jgi:threonine/homoserine/homoserine lactone efflux protein
MNFHFSSVFFAFLTAAVLLAIAPGPGIMYVLTRSMAGGRREGLLSSLGTLVGGLAHMIAAALGISAVLATSAVAYQAVRWAGAFYLVYLGFRMIRNAEGDGLPAPGRAAGDPFRQGIVTEVLNPKTALFFLSFIPQFVDPKAGGVFAQFLLLGMITVIVNSSVDVLVAFLAGPLGEKLLQSKGARRNQRRATGAAMIGLGVFVVARES